jgi:hypothetical protein
MAIKISSGIVIDDTRNISNVNSASFSSNSHIKLPVGTTAQRPSGTPGDLRLNTDTNTFEGYSNEWGSIGGGSSLTVQIISVNTNAVPANCVMTLNANPVQGDTVGFFNKTEYPNSIIYCNTKKIMGNTDNMIFDVIDTGFNLIYTDTTNGWVIK